MCLLTPESGLKVSPICVISALDRFDGYRSDTKASRRCDEAGQVLQKPHENRRSTRS
jgi:hypothetical protein